MTDFSTELLSKIANEAQRKASQPDISAWVSASAGSGKTKVLTDRILKLLLSGESPEKILCLTFTKTAAAEMSNRLFKRLSTWTVIPKEELTQDLISLFGSAPSEDLLSKARRLFARVLDVKGGMKIMTIHSFCQSVLKRVPLEAGLIPTFEVIDENEAKALRAQSAEEAFKDAALREEVAKISVAANEKQLNELMADFNKKKKHFFSLLSQHQSLTSLISKMYAELGVKETDTEESLKKALCPLGDFDEAALQYLNAKSGTIKATILKGKDAEKKEKAEAFFAVKDKIKSLTLLKLTESLLKIGYAILNTYGKLKEKAGVIDYDDMILKTVELLEEKNETAWVLYKLDGGIDHILIDEAQDTNPLQWRVIQLLSDEFFSGCEQKTRTLFAVGDKKQSIYGFQGADADSFEKMKLYFKEKITSAGKTFEEVPLNISFRSTQPIIDLVNYTLSNPAARDGILSPGEEAEHLAFRKDKIGQVEIWPVEMPDNEEKEESFQASVISQSGISGHRKLAVKIADKIVSMLSSGETLSDGKRIEPRDILILVKQRKAFIFEIIRALKERNLPVAGLDRLVLSTHPAVQDLISLARFLLLPQDDLSLAEVLRSPIGNISEEDLYELAHGRGEASLWDRVRALRPVIYEKLLSYLNLTDKETPFMLFSFVLENERTAFLERLGTETTDALDEFLNLTLTYEEKETPSLQGFVNWFTKEEIEIKRDLEQEGPNQIRLMTIHGSKGLEAPIVFLPETRQKRFQAPPIVFKNNLPFWVQKKEMRCTLLEPVFEELKQKEEKEYHRLLYVAMTRARDRLYLCGFNGKNNAPKGNWYDLVTESLNTYRENQLWCLQKGTPVFQEVSAKEKSKETDPPAWLFQNSKEECAPEKPVSPSKIGALEEDISIFSPLGNEEALRYGTAVHKILQLLPDVPPEKRREIAESYMPFPFGVPEKLLSLMEHPDFKPLFGKNSESEVPVMGYVDGTLISGQIDRLAIVGDEVWIVDYKTNKNPPSSKDKIPIVYQKQINAYKSLLSFIFPDKKIRGFLLWTTTLELMESE